MTTMRLTRKSERRYTRQMQIKILILEHDLNIRQWGLQTKKVLNEMKKDPRLYESVTHGGGEKSCGHRHPEPHGGCLYVGEVT